MSIMSKAHQVGEKIIELCDLNARLNLDNINEAGKQVIIELARSVIPPFPEQEKVPVGTIIAYSGVNTPKDYLLLDGRELSKTTYAKLYEAIGDSMGTASTDNYFKIADMTDGRYLRGVEVAGGSVEAGIPDLWGKFIANWRKHGNPAENDIYDGVFSVNKEYTPWEWSLIGSSANFGRTRVLDFSANSYNSVYGNSNTVTPKSLDVRYFIKFR